MASQIEDGGERDVEKGLLTPQPSPTPQGQSPHAEPPLPSPSPSPSSTASAPALVLLNSGKRIDQAGKKKYVKQLTGRHSDPELHLASERGDLAAVKKILDDVDSQIMGTLGGADRDAEVAEVQGAVVNEVNELGETTLFTAEDEGHIDVEELSAREADTRVDNSSQPSGSHIELSTFIQKNVGWLEKYLNSLMGGEDEDEQRGDPTKFPKPQIQHVPEKLGFQKNLERYFKPRAYLFRELLITDLTETYWSKLLKRFINERSTDKGKDLYMKIFNNIKRLTQCFSESLLLCRYDLYLGEFCREDAVGRLFLDGCLTLQFIHDLVEIEIQKFGIRNDEIALAQWDVFLLENQLPYQLLKLLMNGDDDEEDNQNDDKKKKKKSSNNKYKESIKKFIGMNAVVPPNYMHKLFVNIESIQHEPAHLLELLQMAHVSQQRPATRLRKRSDDQSYLTKSFRSATELNSLGITFKPNKSGTFTDAAFATRFLLFGELTLAPLMVDESTVSKLLNMVAWEACTYGVDEFWVTSYICFINSLLHGPEDVKALSSHNIIFNCLGNEQRVVDLFHDISTNLIPDPLAYDSVYAGIEEHLRGKVKLLIAEWLHAHFSNTWSVLAFLGAILAIVLTLIQTYFTAYPPNKG